ncbi:MAG: electron transfer complex subunit TmcD [Desulfovibrio sp.]|uniref:electron transfer complex subunit TmcD n=1 Tax=Desulfovibrio sp. 7SRBS1 TaxID=3378064 RepID=UPI003B407CF3
MSDKSGWNWEPGEKTVADTAGWSSQFEWVEELQASPDGEKIAAIVKQGDEEFNVCVNGEPWGDPCEKAWYLRYGPDGRLTVLAQLDMVWTVAVDGTPWEEMCDFLWETKFSKDGSTIAVCAQSEGRYGMMVNGTPWENMFENANCFHVSADGAHTAAAVQVDPLAQADVIKFQEGVFSCAVDGNVWDDKFVNVWNGGFSPDGTKYAAEVRLNLYEYSIAINGHRWSNTYQTVWEPCFNPKTGTVVAPVRKAGKWSIAEDDKIIWHQPFVQCFHQKFSPDGSKLAAFVATDYGEWAVAVDGTPWTPRVGQLLSELTFSENGQSIAALGKDKEKWYVMLNNQRWNEAFDMAFRPVLSPDGTHCACKVERNGKYSWIVDGKVLSLDCDENFDPTFSPDGSKLLLRYVKDGKYIRRVANVSEL